MKSRSFSVRRWGVSAMAGMTLLGAASIIGEGVSAAATAPSVSAAVTATAPTIPGDTPGTPSTTATAAAGAPISLAINGSVVAGDQIVLTLACPSDGTAIFASTTTVPTNWTSVIGVSHGCSIDTLTAGTGTGAGGSTNPTISLTPSFTLTGVSSQALTISGTYSTLGLASTNFTVGTDANVLWFNVSGNTPAVTLPQTGTTAISTIMITQPANLTSLATAYGVNNNDFWGPTGNVVLTLPTGDTWSGTPSILAPSGATVTPTVTSNTISLAITGTVNQATTNFIQITGMSVVTSSTSKLGDQTVTITGPNTNETEGSFTAGTIFGSVKRIFGATADGTVAAEFLNAFPAGNPAVVLATDIPTANGTDALAASYLEGQLHTGLLITPPTSLGADAQAAIQRADVSTVYVVGGSLAITPTVIAQIKALPVYSNNGLVATSKTVNVIQLNTGATAEGTASEIATYFGNSYGTGSFSAAYSTTGGLYNDTTGSGSPSGPATSVPTAIVIASTDWQDSMSIAPEAYNMHFPVILAGASTSTTLDANASSALTSLGVKQVIIVGGQLALTNAVEAQIAALNGGISVLRIAGIDATDTAAKIANFAYGLNGSGLGWLPANGANSVLTSHSDYWSDSLGAAALGGGASGTFGTEPIILTQTPITIGSYTTSELATLKKLGVSNVTVLGGTLAMPDTTVNTLLQGL